MLIEIKDRGLLTGKAGRLDENRINGVLAVEDGMVQAADLLRQSLEAQDITVAAGKLTDTAQQDIERLGLCIEAFAGTVCAIEGNYRQAQINTIERILKVPC